MFRIDVIAPSYSEYSAWKTLDDALEHYKLAKIKLSEDCTVTKEAGSISLLAVLRRETL